MPEPVQQPDPAQAPPKGRDTSAAAKLDELKRKYRLDKVVNLFIKGPDGKRMGKGPILDEQVFNKFAELDRTRPKRYLDWMLYQAGGGEAAFSRSRELWGDETPDKSPEEFFDRFNREKQQQPTDHIIYSDELNNIAQRLKEKDVDLSALLEVHEQVEQATTPEDPTARFKALVKLLKQHGVAPGKEERISVEIVANKFKAWIKNQLATKARDRVHATSVYSRLIRGQSRQQAEEKWKEMEPRRRREYLYGDEDALKRETFSYKRHWPGNKNVYEQVYNAMRQFLLNADKVGQYNQRVEAYNVRVAERNKTLPPEQQLTPREPVPFNTDIGKVLVDKNSNLTYKGPYPTVYALVKANEEVNELPMHQRVSQDVQYAGPKGTKSRGATIYSDENLDVKVPLTVAAAVEAGHPKWPISDPEQISNVTAQGKYATSTWTKHATGDYSDRTGYFEWSGIQGIPVFFHIKSEGTHPQLRRLYMLVFLSDLTDLQAPYGATIWRLSESSKDMTFSEVMKLLKEQLQGGNQQYYYGLVRSFTKAMNAIKNWGKEFDPHDIIADYVAHHREKMQGKRTLGEQVKIRADQVVQALLE